jgi:hypothetical protein
MKSDKDYAPINLDSEYNLNDDFYSIEQSISKSDNEHKEILFNLTFENSLLLNHETLDIKEDINDNITDKRYFIGKKTKIDTVRIDNQNNIKKNNGLFHTISSNKNQEINNIILEIKAFEKQMTKLESKNEHNKYTFDNIIRKIKNLVLNSTLIFLNKKLLEKYKDSKLILYVMDHSKASNSNILFNRVYLNKTLKEIFSDNVSTKCKTAIIKHNENIIQNLLNEEDDEKRKYFEKILNYKFIDVIKYLRGEKEGLDGLRGLEFYDVRWNKIQKDKNFCKYFLINMAYIEELLKIKNPRNRKKKKDGNI